jgi:hypothetical protein
LNRGGDALDEFTDKLRNSAGTAAQVEAIQLDTLSGSFTELKSAVEGALITIGSRFAPALRAVADAIRDAVSLFNDLPGPLQTVITVGAGVVGVLALIAGSILLLLGPLGLMLQGVAALPVALPVVIGIFGTFASVITGTVIPAIVAVAVALGPITLVALAVAAVVGGLALAWRNNWFDIREKTKAVVQFIKGNLDLLLLFLGPVGLLILGLKRLAGGWSELWEGIKETTARIVNPIIGIINRLIEALNKLPGVNLGILPRIGEGGMSRNLAMAGVSNRNTVIDLRGTVVRDDGDIDRIAQQVRGAMEGAR